MSTNQPHPSIVTKYCEPEVAQWMREGSFKIGTHQEYAKNASGSANGTMSDTREGRGAHLIGGLFKNKSWRTEGGDIYTNITVDSPSPNAIVLGTSVNLNIFCVAAGPYAASQHRAMLDGIASYPGNPAYTAWVELDAVALRDGLRAAMVESLDGQEVVVGRGRVRYGERNRTVMGRAVSAAMSEAGRQQYLDELAFTKPTTFQAEQEYRYAFRTEPLRLYRALSVFTKDMSAIVRSALASCVKAHGIGVRS